MRESRLMTLNIGPQHPSTHGVLRLIVELDGETVVKLVPDIGYLHRGIGKIAETLHYEQFMPYTDRLDYLASFINNLGWAMAAERLFGIEPPPRANYLRVLLSELARIESHLIWLGTHLLDLGAITPLFYCFREKEEIRDLFEEICGARMTHAFCRIGGVREDVTPAFLPKVREFVAKFPKAMAEYEALITDNPIFRRRTEGVGVISAEKAIDYGLSGPSLRGSGVGWDLRKAEPYAAYADLDFEVPVGERGDVFDRYLVRMEEMRQSLRLVQQTAENLPGGPVLAAAPQFLRPTKAEFHRNMQAMIRYFHITIHGASPPPGEVYAAVEGSKGEVGYFVVSDGSPRPVRVQLRGPSFVNLGALEEMAKGQYLADLVAIIGSIDIVLGEVDR
ncbi:MAG TPA: NADH dehydrogenase (quinone) subunit D [bacterium]